MIYLLPVIKSFKEFLLVSVKKPISMPEEFHVDFMSIIVTGLIFLTDILLNRHRNAKF